MLEVFAIIFLSKKFGGIADNKGHSRGLFIALTIIFWVGGEIAGMLLGLIVFEEEGLIMYAFAILGAGLGALTVFLIASSLGNKKKEAPDVLDQQFEN